MKNTQIKNPLVIFVTGMSGAGLKTCISALEDSGVYCIDNLPLPMIEQTLELLKLQNFLEKTVVAFGVHIQNVDNINEFLSLAKNLDNKYQVDTLFLTAEDSVLELRYSANRRRHHFLEKGKKLQEAILSEREILYPLLDIADNVIDTSQLSPHQLTRIVEDRYSNTTIQRNLYVMISSFGFKYGAIHPVDSIFDVRFLKNPYFNNKLRAHTGLDENVRDYIFNDDKSAEFIDRLFEWHQWILPKYFDEGKHYYRIGIGCTGGQHRSVAIVEELFHRLTKESLGPLVINKYHRDVNIISKDKL